jgi:hypothetical protein
MKYICFRLDVILYYTIITRDLYDSRVKTDIIFRYRCLIPLDINDHIHIILQFYFHIYVTMCLFDVDVALEV